jgi:hypothetical protein
LSLKIVEKHALPAVLGRPFGVADNHQFNLMLGEPHQKTIHCTGRRLNGRDHGYGPRLGSISGISCYKLSLDADFERSHYSPANSGHEVWSRLRGHAGLLGLLQCDHQAIQVMEVVVHHAGFDCLVFTHLFFSALQDLSARHANGI